MLLYIFIKILANGYTRQQNSWGTVFTRLGSQTLEPMEPIAKIQVSSVEVNNYQSLF